MAALDATVVRRAEVWSKLRPDSGAAAYFEELAHRVEELAHRVEELAHREAQVPQRVADATVLRDLLGLLQIEPVEDGRTHPGEALLRSLAGGPAAIDAWCLTAIEGTRGEARVASLLRLLSRVGLPRAAEARRRAVEAGLKHDVAEVRDAAIQCVETWEDRGLRDLLLNHADPVPWLRQYARQVAADLVE